MRAKALAIFILCATAMWAQRVPAGTHLTVRINENLSSEKTSVGDAFTGVLEQAVLVNGQTAFRRGADVHGRVTHVKSSGRLKTPGELGLQITRIGGTNVQSQPFYVKGESHTKSNVTKIGGGAAAGAIIGAIAGGGKGAAIGAGVGAAAGTGVAAATGKKPAEVESEAVLQFVTASAVTTSGAVRARRSDTLDSASREHGNDDSAFHRRDDDDDDDRYERRGDYSRIDDRERDILRGCLSGYNYSSLPKGIQKKLARGGTLPPGHAKKLRRDLPGSCVARLPRVPRDIARIIFGDRVILLGRGDRILDWFILGT